jgi:protease-4
MLADDLWAVWRTGVEAQRSGLDVAATLSSWPARLSGANLDQARLARDAGFVDKLLSRTAWHEALKARLGAGDDPDRPGDYRRIAFQDYLNARRPLREKGPAVAVVHVSGTIIDGEAPAGQAGSRTIARLIEDAAADTDVKALVVRIDSPGGSATASEEVRQAMLAARGREIPVVASFGPVAASGGYWIATGADSILAHPGTITGSIGVFGIVPTFEGTLKSVGIRADGVATTPFSGQPDLVGGLNQPTRQLIQSVVEDTYRQFLAHVVEARGLPLPDVETLAEGRVWSGKRALDLKLIDGFGGLDAAVAEAGRRAGIEGKPRVKTFRPERPFLSQILNDLGLSITDRRPIDGLSRLVSASRLSAMGQIEMAIMVARGPLVQTACLACARHLLPRGGSGESDGVRARIRQLLAD